MSEKIPAPKNQAIDAVKAVLDVLIEGAGVEAAVTAGTTAWSFLGAPIIRNIFRWLVEMIAESIDAELGKWAVKLVLRIQRTSRAAEFNEALQPIISGSPTDEEIERAREAAIRVIERNRP